MPPLPTPVRGKVDPMDQAHVMDWAVLSLGHEAASKTTVHLIDMDVHVFGLEEIKGSDLPVSILIVAHGWANKARDMEPFASGLIGEMRRLDSEHKERKRTKDVLVATLDQRNHGDRRRIRNQKTFENNPYRMIETSMGLSGGKADHEYLMEFLPLMLFPQSERKVVEFMSTGFSMGGHVCWRLLRDNPQIRVAVPICSVPSESLGKLFMARELPPGSKESFLPDATRDFFITPPAEGTYAGRHILAIHGAHDALIPWQWGDEDWDVIEKEAMSTGGSAARHIVPTAGHKVSEEMVRLTAEWCWYFGLTEAR